MKKMAVTLGLALATGCGTLDGEALILTGADGLAVSDTKDVSGLPIAVRVERWLLLKYEKITLAKGAESREINQISTETFYETLLFSMDIDRPAAGSIEYALVMDAEKQYPLLIQGKLEDKTIQEVGAIVKSLAEVAAKGAAARPQARDSELQRLQDDGFVVKAKQVTKTVLVDLRSGAVKQEIQ